VLPASGPDAPRLTLVVSPLIALMKDQIDALQRGHRRAAPGFDARLDEYRQAMDESVPAG